VKKSNPSVLPFNLCPKHSKTIEPPRVSTAKKHQATPHRVDIVLHLGMAGISFQEKIMEIQENLTVKPMENTDDHEKLKSWIPKPSCC